MNNPNNVRTGIKLANKIIIGSYIVIGFIIGSFTLYFL